MKLCIIVIDDCLEEARKLKENLENVFGEYHDSDLLRTIDDLYVEMIEGEGKPVYKDGMEHKYYDKERLLDKVKEIRTGKREEKLGICLDIKLTEKEEDSSYAHDNGGELETAREVYQYAVSEDINVCPITGLPNFDEASSSILETEIDYCYFDKITVVTNCNDSDVVRLIYFMAKGVMPDEDAIDNMFDYD